MVHGLKVEQLAFNPMRPHLLYASFRRHDAIYEWDIRGDAQMPVRTFRRGRSVSKRDSNRTEAAGTVTTNQKLRFDIDISGQILGAGGQVRTQIATCASQCNSLHNTCRMGRYRCSISRREIFHKQAAWN